MILWYIFLQKTFMRKQLFSDFVFWLFGAMKWYLCYLCVSGNSKSSKINLFRSYFMIINERNNIEKYSIICMFRKHFENILPFFEIIFVLSQAYLLILLKFRMWFKYGLKAQKLLAQGSALGMMAISKAPCKGKSFVYCQVFESFCPYRATVLRP